MIKSTVSHSPHDVTDNSARIAPIQYLVRGRKGKCPVGELYVCVCVCVWTWSFGREGLVSWGSLVSMPDHINQHVAHGRNKLENKKSIKVSEWNRGRENSFMMKLNSPYSAVDPLPMVWLFTPDTIHHYAATNDSNYHTCYSYNTHTIRA